MRITTIVCCALSAIVLTQTADAAVMFASSAAGGPGELYTINPANGAMVSDIGPLNDLAATNYPITGLAFNPISGVLFGSTGNAGTVDAKLVTINPATALVTVIGNFDAGPTNSSGVPATMADIGFDSAGNLYGVSSIGGPDLYSINPVTGKATLVGSNTVSTSTTGGGLAISSGAVFYGTPTASRFGTYNSGTGAFTNIANPAKPTGGGAYGALDFDESGVLYGLNVGSGSPPPTALVIINPGTGAVTNVGLSINSLDAIAFQPIPEPTGLALLSGSAVVTLLRRKR
jgi:hypothetical protein